MNSDAIRAKTQSVIANTPPQFADRDLASPLENVVSIDMVRQRFFAYFFNGLPLLMGGSEVKHKS
ncbi:hypothetical protein [Agrobacterium tumefaciens]|uniref:hypothetical protein n=1 Tax=Agrobacterium tumefaciens TaxID=358 RepID=UPI001F190E46|nr:hypothetical protein [Agrobacterium tumefaciens]